MLTKDELEAMLRDAEEEADRDGDVLIEDALAEVDKIIAEAEQTSVNLQ